MMEVHCKKLEVDAACALAIISARCSSLTGASVKWRMERWLRSTQWSASLRFSLSDKDSGFGECVNCGATICAIRHITTRAAGIISTIPAKSITSAAVGLAMGAGSWTYWLRESREG